MLEHYFVRPTTVDRIRAAWLGDSVEQYVCWLRDNGYAKRSVFTRVPLLIKFGDFAKARGANTDQQLPDYIDGFVRSWAREHSQWCRNKNDRSSVINAAKGPVKHFLQFILSESLATINPAVPEPFADQVGGFFDYLRNERGLQKATIERYLSMLRSFERYLNRMQVRQLTALSPTILSAFIVDSSERLSARTLLDMTSVLRVFLAFLYRQRLITIDLSRVIEAPQRRRLVDVPRSINWADVQRMLAGVDRRSPVGKRDYAMLLLMVTYGLRAREIAALTLDCFEWKRDRLLLLGRKAGHTTAYPLSTEIGEAVIQYLQYARPESDSRILFIQVVAPYRPINWWSVSQQAAHYLRKAGISVPRAGSHTLRHSCAQRLVDGGFSLKEIGDYLGHSSAETTAIYSKVQIETLREVALSDGEGLL